MIIVQATAPAAGVKALNVDPARYTTPSDRVQIQNLSGFQLSVQIGANQQSIMPFSVATIGTAGSPDLYVLPSATIGAQKGSITLVWLQPGDESATRDGPITLVQTQTYILTVTTVTINITYTISNCPPFTVSVTINLLISGTTNTVSVTGVETGTVYYSQTLASGQHTITFTATGDASFTLSSAGGSIVDGKTTAYAQ